MTVLRAPYPAPAVVPEALTPRQVGIQFRRLLEKGHVLRPAGTARVDPPSLLRLGYTPRYRIDFFATRFYLSNLRQDDQFRFFVAYVRLPQRPAGRGAWPIYPRIFYKDSSLVWRCASHFIASDRDQWIGKGALKPVPGDEDLLASAEETTDLPFEIQAALDDASRRDGRARADHRAIPLVLRQGPDGRIEPYADFTEPRRLAMARHPVNGGKDVAWFARDDRPSSLKFAPGFAPDLRRGVVDLYHSRSRLYGGDIAKYRILSRNRQVQYTFIAGPRNVWIMPPQTLTRELMTYGVRPIDVPCAENLCLPGYEFHYHDSDNDASSMHSQIPAGFAGAASEIDSSRADTSPWNDHMPIVKAFRRLVLGR